VAKKAVSVMVFQEALPFGDLSLTQRGVMTGPKGKAVVKAPHRKRGLTPAQVWARDTFRVDYDQLPPGRHQAIGCGCVMTVESGKTHFSTCTLHAQEENGLPRFDLPEIWVKKAIEAERDREWYFHLPFEPLSRASVAELAKAALVWDRRVLGDPKSYPGLFTFDDSCGCRFKPVKLTVKGQGSGRERFTRDGISWFAARWVSCGQEGERCEFALYPLRPNLHKIIRQK